MFLLDYVKTGFEGALEPYYKKDLKMETTKAQQAEQNQRQKKQGQRQKPARQKDSNSDTLI